jgi:hypothetical protein
VRDWVGSTSAWQGGGGAGLSTTMHKWVGCQRSVHQTNRVQRHMRHGPFSGMGLHGIARRQGMGHEGGCKHLAQGASTGGMLLRA